MLLSTRDPTHFQDWLNPGRNKFIPGTARNCPGVVTPLLKSRLLVTLSLLSVSPSHDSAAAKEKGPRLHRGIQSKLKQLSDHRYSSDADHIRTKYEDGLRQCYHYTCFT